MCLSIWTSCESLLHSGPMWHENAWAGTHMDSRHTVCVRKKTSMVSTQEMCSKRQVCAVSGGLIDTCVFGGVWVSKRSPLWSWFCSQRSTSIQSCQAESCTPLPPDTAPSHTTIFQLQWTLGKQRHRSSATKTDGILIKLKTQRNKSKRQHNLKVVHSPV